MLPLSNRCRFCEALLDWNEISKRQWLPILQLQLSGILTHFLQAKPGVEWSGYYGVEAMEWLFVGLFRRRLTCVLQNLGFGKARGSIIAVGRAAALIHHVAVLGPVIMPGPRSDRTLILLFIAIRGRVSLSRLALSNNCPLLYQILNVTPSRRTNQRCESSATCWIYSSSVVSRSNAYSFFFDAKIRFQAKWGDCSWLIRRILFNIFCLLVDHLSVIINYSNKLKCSVNLQHLYCLNFLEEYL